METRDELESELNKHNVNKSDINIEFNERDDSSVYSTMNDWIAMVNSSSKNKLTDIQKDLIKKLISASNVINEHNRKGTANYIFQKSDDVKIGDLTYTIEMPNFKEAIKNELPLFGYAQIHTEEKKFIVCPYCGNDKSHSVSHILSGEHGNSFGPWYCDECGGSISGKLDSDGKIKLELSEQKMIHTFDLLKYFENSEEFYIIVRGLSWSNSENIFEGKEYFYAEHTCPTNFLQVEKVIQKNDSDPHGIFQYISSIPATLENEELIENCTEFNSIFSVFKEYAYNNLKFDCKECYSRVLIAKDSEDFFCMHNDLPIGGRDFTKDDGETTPDWCPKRIISRNLNND